MIYKQFQDLQLSQLGFGAMRLPLVSEEAGAAVDEKQVEEMIAYAISHGVNYFDTAYPYHGGTSETIVGKILKNYPRDTFYLATKYPGHQISKTYDPAAIFEEQLQKCQVEYFDFYLLHNVYENSIGTYLDPRWKIVDYFIEQKRKGRIRHLGFSTHGHVDVIRRFLDIYGEELDFCQIQLNYLDWSLQDAKSKYELLTERGIPVWVMEPVRGGKLAQLSEGYTEKLRELRPEESTAAWGFRWLQGLPNVHMVLSGMSNMEQMKDNVKTFDHVCPLSEKEEELLFAIAEGLKDSVPCTGCRYCCDGCPKGLDIPGLLSIYNDIRYLPSVNSVMRLDALPEDKKPSACVACGKCTKICPQNIDVPGAMKDFAERIAAMPSWAEICRQREEANRKAQAAAKK